MRSLVMAMTFLAHVPPRDASITGMGTVCMDLVPTFLIAGDIDKADTVAYVSR
ncbi:hypothetical protein [Cutibacterium avidum]|uniref:hypothetical protein n=1 Tax=Cutibacterium avidum TaxID=33010 RepID=UPI0015593C3D|nr:hypothetical protein [Cutibacterium avidum]